MTRTSAIIAAFLLTLALVITSSMLYFTSKLIIKSTGDNTLKPSLTSNYTMSKGANKKAAMLAKLALLFSPLIGFGIPGLMLYGILAPEKK